MKLHPRHRRILAYALQMPGASYADIAKASRTKVHTVRYVIQLYISRQWLRQIYSVSPSLLGLRLTNVFFSVPPPKAAAMLQFVQHDPRITWVAEQTGNPRYEITALVRDPLELEDLFDTMARKTGAVFQNRFWAIETSRYEFGQRTLGLVTKEPLITEIFSRAQKPIRLAQLDKKLIDIRRGSPEGAAATTAELARALNLPHTTVAYHLRKLTDLGVLSPPLYFLRIENTELTQYQLVLTLSQTSGRLEKALVKFCGENPLVSTLIKGFGGWDYKILVYSETPASGLEVQDALERDFSGLFSDIMLLTRRRVISARTDLSNHPELE
jgi:DNA-binding Lrp family transcriptional regulator